MRLAVGIALADTPDRRAERNSRRGDRDPVAANPRTGGNRNSDAGADGDSNTARATPGERVLPGGTERFGSCAREADWR